MSAYGTISRPAFSTLQLSPTAWKVRSKPSPSRKDVGQQPAPELSIFIIMYHLTLPNASTDLVAFMHEESADEIDRGDTYPQEADPGTRLSREAFEKYFFSTDVLVGLCVDSDRLVGIGVDAVNVSEDEPVEISSNVTPEEVRNEREWKDCVAGFYYIKPNYPGRSSHICNAGFVVPFNARGKGFARVLARSYLYYAPRLGYEASVFNLVYVNNAASIRLWEALGFTKAGRTPRAGRLKRKDGQEDEYVDAWVYYKRFISDEETSSLNKQSAL